MSNFQLLVILGILAIAILIPSSSFPRRPQSFERVIRPRLHRIFPGHAINEEDDDGRSSWDSLTASIDEYDDEDETCATKTRLQLTAIRKEIRSLAALVGGLRKKLDPDFQMPEIMKEPPESKCPDGFTYLEQSGSCYNVIFQRFNWKSAMEQCKNLNSYLVSITTEDESNALTKYLSEVFSRPSLRSKCPRMYWPDGETALWTSGQRLNETDCGSDFVWKERIDEPIPFNFTNWIRGEPNCYDPNEFCMEIIPTHGSAWNDNPCSIRSCSICEYKPE